MVLFRRPFVISVYYSIVMSQTIVNQISDTAIKVKTNTRDRLKNLGNLSYTYDMIIAELLDELLDEYEEKNKWVQFFVINVIKKEKIIQLKIGFNVV